MAEVPQRQRAGVVDEVCDAGHVGAVPRPVRDVAQHHERRVRPERGGDVGDGGAGVVLRVQPADGETALAGDALHDEAVGGEVVAVDHDFRAAGTGSDRGARQFVEEHARGIRHDALPGCGAEDHFPQAVADPLR